MSVSIYDLEIRANTLVKKYERFAEKEEPKKERPTDAFEQLFQQTEDSVDQLREKAEGAASESNRAVVARVNAEVRRGKHNLAQTNLPMLIKLARKKDKSKAPDVAGPSSGATKPSKGISTEELEDRHNRIAELEANLLAIPDGVHIPAAAPKGKAKVVSSSHEIRLDIINEGGLGRDATYYQSTEQSRAFRQEYELAKRRQDDDLDDISRGLGKLKDLANNMDEELGKQTDLVEAIDHKMDNTNADLRSMNTKLKQTITSEDHLEIFVW
eukprot:CAMPEP_0196580358 /NCGR_PEP_ID=MMETSP1081-20130531/28582_1 /TAXON_ID=36882 /ORGANISM="Pyramimonas amylifera, Strain CCMP720" /LENGTH=269 /DNA_ID=CAMNT_0041900207 /DNA_START=95 /DNA_END=902 /DNA_ORIENTATION=+